MDMDLEYGVDPGLDLQCDVCGMSDEGGFYLDGGFYYCSRCNTQSQGSRHFVEEEQPFEAGAMTQSRVSILRDKKKSSEDSTHRRIKLSSWEVYNLVLKALTNKLIELGFPQLLKHKVFQLWTDYLRKRKVIFVSQQADKSSTVTHAEPLTNIYSLYGRQPRPAKVSRKDSHKTSDTAEEDGNTSATASKHRRARAKKKAFEQSYLDHVSLSQEKSDKPRDVFDDYLEGLLASVSSSQPQPLSTNMKEESTNLNRTGLGPQSSKPQNAETQEKKCRTTGTPRPRAKLVFSDGFQRIRKSMVEKGETSVKAKVTDFRRTSLPIRGRPYLSRHATTELEPERFTMRTLLILLFVALRQIGAKILLTDILRLYHEGTLCIDNIGSILSPSDAKEVDWTCNYFLRRPRIPYDLQEVVQATHRFLTYMEMDSLESQFPYPTFAQFVAKFIQDLRLPYEFSHFIKQHNRVLSIQEIVQDLTSTHLPLLLKLAPELFILATFVLHLKMLFALDDVTERYQSTFARKVNEIVDKVMKNKRIEKSRNSTTGSLDLEAQVEWGKLFVLEEWFLHHRLTDRLVKQEKSSLSARTQDIQPNVVSTHFLMGKFGHHGAPRVAESVVEASDGVKSIFSNLSYDLQAMYKNVDEFADEENDELIPDRNPAGETLNLPKEDVISEYLANYPKVAHPEFNNSSSSKSILFQSFSKRRIDFIFEPGKYIKILEKAGYLVKVLAGDARQYTEAELAPCPKTLILFQPFKMYDDFVGQGQSQSGSLSFLLNLCSSSAFQGSNVEQTKTMLGNLVEGIGNLYCKRCRASNLPLTGRS